MIIGICIIRMYVPSSQSLKEKRHVIKSLKDKIRTNFNVSIAEVDNLNVWQKATIGIAALNTSKKYIDTSFNEILSLIKKNRFVDLIDYSIDMI